MNDTTDELFSKVEYYLRLCSKLDSAADEALGAWYSLWASPRTTEVENRLRWCEIGLGRPRNKEVVKMAEQPYLYGIDEEVDEIGFLKYLEEIK